MNHCTHQACRRALLATAATTFAITGLAGPVSPAAAQGGDTLPVYRIDGKPSIAKLGLVTKLMGASSGLNKKLGLVGYIAPDVAEIPTRDLGAGPAGEEGQATVQRAFDMTKISKIKAPDVDKTVKVLDKLLRRLGLRPEDAKLHTATSTFSVTDAAGKVVGEVHPERQMSYALKLANVPLHGPGAKIGASWNHTGDLSQLDFRLPELKRSGQLPKVSPQEADAAAKLLVAPCTASQPTVLTLPRRLTYWVHGQEFPAAKRVYPMYEYSPVLGVDGQKVSPRTFTVPAVQTGFTAQATARSEAGKVIADAQITGGRAPYRYSWSSCTTTVPSTNGEHVEYDFKPRGAATGPVTEELLLTVRDADGLTAVTKATVQVTPAATASSSRRPRARAAERGTFEVGGEYIAASQGIPNSKANVEKFVNYAKASSVAVAFLYGEGDVWESDFTDADVQAGGSDHIYADNVDLMYFSGHGDPNAIYAKNYSTATYDEVNWGDGDLEWMVLSACLTLEKTAASHPSNRWGKQAFQGLHTIFGFGTTAADVADEGNLFAAYAFGTMFTKPMSLKDAWLKATAATEPAGKIVSVMGPYTTSLATNFDDYWWGKGPVSADIPKSQTAGYYLYERTT